MAIRRGLAATLAALALFSMNAVAQRFYIGASGGTTRVETDYEVQVTQQVASVGSGDLHWIASDLSVDPRGSAGRFFAGMRFSEMFALEADYTRLGSIATGFTMQSTNPVLAPHGFTRHETDNEADAVGIALLAHVPLARDVSLFGRAGVARTRLRQAVAICSTFSDPPGSPVRQSCADGFRMEVKETRPVAGLGIGWRFAERFALRASWDRYFGVGNGYEFHAGGRATLGEFDIDYFGIGATFSF